MNDRERGIFKRKEPLTRQEQLRNIEEYDRGRKERMKSMREHTPRNIALSKILGANTPEKIEQARRTIREWIEEHPEDKNEFGRYASDLMRMEISVGAKKTGGRKFVAEDVVRRDLTLEEMEAPWYVNRKLRFLLEKNRDDLPRLEGLWPGLSEETHERWRRSLRQDMEVLRRLGALRQEGKMDEEGERTYGELLVVLRRARPILRRLGLARPSVPLEGD